MKKVIKNINIIFIVAILCFFCSALTVQAATIGDNLLSNITSGANSLENMGATKSSDWGITTDDFSIIFGLAQILWVIAGLIAIAGTMYLAFKYGTGTSESKASIKGKLIGWAVICFILVVPWAVWKLVASIV